MKIARIFEYSSRFYTLTHSPTNVRIYSYKQIWHERMSEYIRKRKIDTNECPNIYSWPIYSNIRIFEYIRHTLVQMCKFEVQFLQFSSAKSSQPIHIIMRILILFLAWLLHMFVCCLTCVHRVSCLELSFSCQNTESAPSANMQP